MFIFYYYPQTLSRTFWEIYVIALKVVIALLQMVGPLFSPAVFVILRSSALEGERWSEIILPV
jgi:lipopolysaccharide biosynthesis protein